MLSLFEFGFVSIFVFFKYVYIWNNVNSISVFMYVYLWNNFININE